MNATLKTPVAEGAPPFSAGEPRGLVPGGRGERGGIRRLAVFPGDRGRKKARPGSRRDGLSCFRWYCLELEANS